MNAEIGLITYSKAKLKLGVQKSLRNSLVYIQNMEIIGRQYQFNLKIELLHKLKTKWDLWTDLSLMFQVYSKTLLTLLLGKRNADLFLFFYLNDIYQSF